MWRRVFSLALLSLLALLLQSAVIPHLGGFLGQLDLMLVLTIAVALVHGPRGGAAFGLAAGLLRDVALGFGLGFYALPLYVIGYGIGHLGLVVFRESILVPFLAGLASTAAYWLILTVTNGFLYGHWLSGHFWPQLLTMLLVNGLSVPALYSLLSRHPQGLMAQSRGD